MGINIDQLNSQGNMCELGETIKDCRYPMVKMCLTGTDAPKSGEGLRIAVYQGEGLAGDQKAIDYNLKCLKEWAEKAASYQAQILVLPELFLCGYNILPDDIPHVVRTEAEVQELVGPIARKNGLAIVCPYAEKDPVTGEHYDTILTLDKSGEILRNYRKCHLWGEGEKTNWKYPYVDHPEEAYRPFKVNGINVGLLNCYEAEFPELYRIYALQGTQVVIAPTAADVGTVNAEGVFFSSWTYPDISKTAIPGNAYSNKMFVVYSNHSMRQFRSDGSLSGVYLGNSAIADPYGELLAHANNMPTLLIADCVPSNYMPTHPYGESDYIKDRRPELYAALTRMEAKLPDGSTYHYPKNPNKRS
ncbi:nitrilase-related carbon-nitrogen hydrolase [Vibrio sp. 10N.261.55.A7]|uniref:nitrilase-related carbon-nitrogen hydrolase n=1 Tax=Vibrio sp. 10N.261.55.A7 TaxID=1880851 RepID=UPI0018E46E0F|nr:nitrilase-related carbon-nitrogen hydrolase [Vibrio sp. 10N.261.55.A7]